MRNACRLHLLRSGPCFSCIVFLQPTSLTDQDSLYVLFSAPLEVQVPGEELHGGSCGMSQVKNHCK